MEKQIPVEFLFRSTILESKPASGPSLVGENFRLRRTLRDRLAMIVDKVS